MIDPPPENPTLELSVALVKAAASAIPYVGGVVSEVGNLYLNPVEKRRQKWTRRVTEAINEIESRFNILPSVLAADERFISMLYEATAFAIKTHREEKLEALQNALISSVALDQTSEDSGFQLLRLVDELTPTHLAILKCINGDEPYFAEARNLEAAYLKFIETTGITIERAVFEYFVHDLESKLLLRESDLGTPSSFSEAPAILLAPEPRRPLKLTLMARAFLQLITAEKAPVD